MHKDCNGGMDVDAALVSLTMQSFQQQVQRLQQAGTERFTIRYWTVPIPQEHRLTEFPRCGRCSANFFLLHR